MTVGPLPPAVRQDVTLSPLTAPLDASGGDAFEAALRAVAGTDDAHFAGTPVRRAAERFDERGFFSDAGALPSANLAPAEPQHNQLPCRSAASACAADALAQSGVPPLPPGGGIATQSPAEVLPTARDARASAAPSAQPPAGRPAPPAAAEREHSVGQPIAAPRADRSKGNPSDVRSTVLLPATLRPLPRTAPRAPVSVTVDAGTGGAVITVSLPKLAQRQVDALRSDIAALLRRHGLVLDDLRLLGGAAGDRNRSGG